MKVSLDPLFHTLNPQNTLSINRLLAHAIGLNNAVVYGALLSKYAWYSTNDLLDDEGFFYSTADDLQESTALTRRQQDKCIKELVDTGLIFVKVKGLPAKRHFKVNTDVNDVKPLIETGLTICQNLNNSNDDKVKQVLTKGENLVLTKGENLVQQNVEQNLSNKTKDIKPKIEKDNIYVNPAELTNGEVKSEPPKKQSTKKLEEEFEELWKMYPRKQGKPAAKRHFLKARKDGVEFETIKNGLLVYKEYIELKNVEQQYIKQGGTWFNGYWEDEYDLEALRGAKANGKYEKPDSDNAGEDEWWRTANFV